MKYEYIIILLLLVILALFTHMTCNERKQEVTREQVYDSINKRFETIGLSIDTFRTARDTLFQLIEKKNQKQAAITKKYVPKYDTLRHSSTVKLDSVIQSILQRHDLLHN